MPLDQVAADCCQVRRVLHYEYAVDVRDGQQIELDLDSCFPFAIGELFLLAELW